MKIDIERFLALASLLATAGAGACTTNTVGDDDGTGGTGAMEAGTDSGTGGKGTGGTAGTGGAAATDGGLDATTEASAEAGDATPEATIEAGVCLGDTVAAVDAGDVDAGSEGIPSGCEALPYSSTWCEPDAGVEDTYAWGYTICSAMQYQLRPGVQAALLECIETQVPTEDPCGDAHRAAALGCLDMVLAKACEVDFAADGGVDPCATFASQCSASAQKCHDTLSAFSEESAGFVGDCLGQASADAGTCDSVLDSCVLPYGVTR